MSKMRTNLAEYLNFMAVFRIQVNIKNACHQTKLIHTSFEGRHFLLQLFWLLFKYHN